MQEAHAARPYHRDVCSGFGGTEEGQSSSDAGSAFTHALQAMMTLSPTYGKVRIDSDAIVPYMKGEVVAVSQVDA